MNPLHPVNVSEKLALINEHWTPKVIAELNDYQIKLARLSGEFVWHQHDETDEMFYCVGGVLKIELPDRTVTLHPGDVFVVPRGVQHRPVADEECQVMLIEPIGVINTGDAESDRTAPNDDWV